MTVVDAFFFFGCFCFGLLTGVALGVIIYVKVLRKVLR